MTVGSGGGTSGSALSAGTLGLSGVVPVYGDVMQLDDNDNDHDDYNNDRSSANDDKDDSEGAGAPLEEEDAESCKNCLLRGIVCRNNDYSLGAFVQLPDPSHEAPAVFGTVELQAPTFFASRSVVQARGFHEGDAPICAPCLRWNLVAPFSKCNRDRWTGFVRCSYVQHAQCKDVGSGPFPALVQLLT